MNRNTTIIIGYVLILCYALFACKKQEQETLTPKITDEKVEVTATTATFTWTVDWPGKLISVVEVSENEDMRQSTIYGSEIETENHNFTVTVTDLKMATKYYYRHVVWNHFYVDNKFVMEVKSFTTKTDVPKVKTVEVTDVTRTTAAVIGEVTDECGSEVTERGVCWGTSHNPTTSGSHLNSGIGIGSYSIAISNLEVGKTYYVRAYAKNSNGTAYGEELDFVTGDAVKPTVTTAEVTNIDWRTATGGGEVTDDGDATVTERGICWSTSHNPEVSGSHASNGTGMGSYIVNMTGLTAGTTYYVRAYAKNIAGLNYGNEVSFETKAPELPIVSTNTVTDISWRTATSGGNVTSDGGTEVTERGICWGTSHNPDLSNGFSHLAASSAGTGSFTCSLTGLNPGTNYYVRAYSINSQGTSYGEEKDFTTQALQKPMVTTATVSQLNFTNATAVGGGEVTSDGGDAVTERGIYFGTSPNPANTGTKLVASSAGTGSFTCTMTGLVEETTYYVCAYATNGQGSSYGSEKSFSYNPPPTGAINGIFSVSSSKKVYFSKGNLQYNATQGTHDVVTGGTEPGTWRFAEKQWNYVGSENENISSSYNGWIDLFGWGTSGWKSGANCYQPLSHNNACGDYLPGGNYLNNLTGSYAKADWGVYNAISNGGGVAGMWRTLTMSEWSYVFNSRNTSTINGIVNARYAKARVADIHGVILFPDNYMHPIEVSLPLGINDEGNTGWYSNNYSVSDWNKMETAGAVFLPAAGYRWSQVLISGSNLWGRYWSTSFYNENTIYYKSYSIQYGDDRLILDYDSQRCTGLSVRLVRDVE